jgi:hypothetical protein
VEPPPPLPPVEPPLPPVEPPLPPVEPPLQVPEVGTQVLYGSLESCTQVDPDGQELPFVQSSAQNPGLPLASGSQQPAVWPSPQVASVVQGEHWTLPVPPPAPPLPPEHEPTSGTQVMYGSPLS